MIALLWWRHPGYYVTLWVDLCAMAQKRFLLAAMKDKAIAGRSMAALCWLSGLTTEFRVRINLK